MIRPRRAGAQHGIGVVEHGVDAGLPPVAAELRAEQQRPVAPRGLGLDIVGVAGANLPRQQVEAPMRRPDRLQRRPLAQYLGADDLRPEPLSQRLRRSRLVGHAARLLMVPVRSPEERGRHVVGAADHQRDAAFRQRGQKVIGISDAVRRRDDGPYVVNRHPPDLGLVRRNRQETARLGKMAAVLGDLRRCGRSWFSQYRRNLTYADRPALAVP